MPQSQTTASTATTATTATTASTASTVSRITRWRYQSAVQAARTLNAVGRVSTRPAPHLQRARPPADQR